MTQEQKSEIGRAVVGALLALIIAVAGILGYDAWVVTPREQTLVGAEVSSRGGAADKTYDSLAVVSRLNDYGTLYVEGNSTLGGALSVTGAITGGSFSPATFTNASTLYADTGTFTTSLTLAGTAVARLNGSAIDAASLKVAATPVALVSGSSLDETSIKVGATPVALLQGSAIDAASLKVALTPVALLSGSTLNETAISVGGTPVAVQVGALSAGQKIVCGSTVITGTGQLPHGLATPVYVLLSQAQDATGDGARLTYTNTAGFVMAKAWNSALTPAPATTPVTVNWCINGTP